jgi:hypothetical protein
MHLSFQYPLFSDWPSVVAGMGVHHQAGSVKIYLNLKQNQIRCNMRSATGRRIIGAWTPAGSFSSGSETKEYHCPL